LSDWLLLIKLEGVVTLGLKSTALEDIRKEAGGLRYYYYSNESLKSSLDKSSLLGVFKRSESLMIFYFKFNI
jgi:hypothetical protein